jgi:hypothetical protein
MPEDDNNTEACWCYVIEKYIVCRIVQMCLAIGALIYIYVYINARNERCTSYNNLTFLWV